MVREPPRTLPLRVPLVEGEALDSWLVRLAHRNGISVGRLLPVLGLDMKLLRGWRNHSLVWRLPPDLLRRIETQTGLPPHTLDQAVLDHYEPLGWKPTVGSRYCPACLRLSGGTWLLRWQLPYTFACTRHRCLLAAVCPACAATPHSRWSGKSGLLAPTWCSQPRPGGQVCGTDLLTHPRRRLPPADPRLAAQEWISQRLNVMDEAARRELRDLDVLSVWLRQRIEPDDVRHLGRVTVNAVAEYVDPRQHLRRRRQQPTASLVVAAIAAHTVALIDGDQATRYQRFVPLFRDAGTKRQPATADELPPGPKILSHKRMTRLSTPLQRRLLASCDPHLPVSERLRYRTSTPAPRLPEPGSTTATDRAQHIPQYLWPEWIIRFKPPTRLHVDSIATDIPAALLIPGNPVRNEHATGEVHPWSNWTSQTLRHLTDQQPDTLAVICALADYLDAHGAPIDYQRRRAVFTDIDLTGQQWLRLCATADVYPGRAARHVHARRYLFQLLTGADLSNPTHQLAFHDPNDKAHYHSHFLRVLSPPLRKVLHQHAAGLLAEADIEEPVSWAPPGDCVAGLALPGRDPDDIDLAALRELLFTDRLPPTIAAQRLGASVEHVRYAMQHLHRPPNPPRTHRRPPTRAPSPLTREFFQREYVEAGKDLHTIAAGTGVTRRWLARRARDLGFHVTRAPSTPPIDADWLREQAETLRRTNGDIASELGLTGETIRRWRRLYGIASLPTGGHGHTVTYLHHPALPADIRRAVEGQRTGWQRLHRFQQMTTYPSMNSAAQALGLHTQNLNLQLQRLEADIGARLLQRAPHRYAPMTPTRRGQRLLDDLDQPAIRELLHRYAGANARPKIGPYKRRGRTQQPSSA
jgi:hypothetical protein